MGLHCLLGPVCSNTQSKYGNLINRTPLEIILEPPLAENTFGMGVFTVYIEINRITKQ